MTNPESPSQPSFRLMSPEQQAQIERTLGALAVLFVVMARQVLEPKATHGSDLQAVPVKASERVH